MGSPRRRSATSRISRKSRPGPRGARGRGSGSVTITSVSPVGNTRGSRPTIRANVKDGRGAVLSKSDIGVLLDGQPVRDFQYRRTTGSLGFAAGKLAPGSHTVRVEVAAGPGRSASKSWSFATV